MLLAGGLWPQTPAFCKALPGCFSYVSHFQVKHLVIFLSPEGLSSVDTGMADAKNPFTHLCVPNAFRTLPQCLRTSHLKPCRMILVPVGNGYHCSQDPQEGFLLCGFSSEPQSPRWGQSYPRPGKRRLLKSLIQEWSCVSKPFLMASHRE